MDGFARFGRHTAASSTSRARSSTRCENRCHRTGGCRSRSAYSVLPSILHQFVSEATAHSAVFWPTPTVTKPCFLRTSELPEGIAFLIRPFLFRFFCPISDTSTVVVSPGGIHSRPFFFLFPTFSVFLASIDMMPTGCATSCRVSLAGLRWLVPCAYLWVAGAQKNATCRQAETDEGCAHALSLLIPISLRIPWEGLCGSQRRACSSRARSRRVPRREQLGSVGLGLANSEPTA